MNEIICGKSEEVLKDFGDGSIDMIITSPPYNFDREYDEYDDKVDYKKYFNWLNTVWKECYRILRPDGRIAINTLPVFTDNIPTHHIISEQLRKIGFGWKAEIIWHKGGYNCPVTCWGSYKSPSAPYLKYSWEYIEVFVKSEYKKFGYKGDITITADDFKRDVDAMWKIPPERQMKKFGHPAMFPEELPRRLINLFTYKSDIILDPFNGAGTTTKVAHHEGRVYVGIDVSEKYCEIARQRIKDDIYYQTKL